MVFQHHLDDDDDPERIIKTCRLVNLAAIIIIVVVVVVVFPTRVGGVFSKRSESGFTKVVEEMRQKSFENNGTQTPISSPFVVSFGLGYHFCPTLRVQS